MNFKALYVFMLKLDMLESLFHLHHTTAENNMANLKLMETICKQMNSVNDVGEIERELDSIKCFLLEHKK